MPTKFSEKVYCNLIIAFHQEHSDMTQAKIESEALKTYTNFEKEIKELIIGNRLFLLLQHEQEWTNLSELEKKEKQIQTLIVKFEEETQAYKKLQIESAFERLKKLCFYELLRLTLKSQMQLITKKKMQPSKP